MPTTSSLLRSAEAARKKTIAYEDQVAAFEWNNSAKTADDYTKYAQYLNNRASTSQASEALSYQQKIVTARRAFTSHEIQRQTIDILEGKSNLQTKQAAIGQLYDLAIANDDLNLAQSLRLQWDNVDRAIQSEQEQVNKMAATAASLNAKTIEDAITSIKKERGFFQTTDANGQPIVVPTMAELKAIYQDSGEEGINEIMQQVAALRPDGSVPNFWDLALNTVDAIANMYDTAANVAGLDTATGRGYLQDKNRVLNGETSFDFAPGIGKLSIQDIKDAVDASRAGQQLFVPSQENGENIFRKTEVTDYVYGRDEAGNYKLISVRGEAGDFADGSKQTVTVTTKDGKTKQVSVNDAKKILSDAGYVVSTSGGQLKIIDSKGLGLPGVSPNTSFTVVIGRDGNLRMKSVDGRIFDLALDEVGNIKPKEIKANEDVSIFGEKGLGDYSKASKQGIEITKQLLGQNKATDYTAPENLRVADFSGENNFAANLDTTDLLQRGQTIAKFNSLQLPGDSIALDIANNSPFMSAELQQRMNTAAAKIQRAVTPMPQTYNPQPVAAPQLQSSATAFNINQTPVPKNAQIQVAAPTAQPKVTVAAPTPQPTIKVAAPQPKYIQTENKLSF